MSSAFTKIMCLSHSPTEKIPMAPKCQRSKYLTGQNLPTLQNTTQYHQNSAIYSPKLTLYSILFGTCCIHYKFRFLLRKQQQQQTRRLRNNLAELLLRNILRLFSLLGTSNSSVLSLIPMYLVRPIPASTVLSSPTSVVRVCTIPLEHNIWQKYKDY